MKTKALFLFLVIAIITACSDDNSNTTNVNTGQHTGPGWTVSGSSYESANWSVADSTINILSSMMVYGTLPDQLLSTLDESDRIAFFCEGECLDVTSPIRMKNGEWIYIANIYSPHGTERITMAYASSKTKQIYYWANLFNYEHDGVQGSTEEPFCVNMSTSKPYPYSMNVYVTLPAELNSSRMDNDEMALFCANECRGILKYNEQQKRFEGQLMMVKPIEEMQIRYFSASTGKYYMSHSQTAFAYIGTFFYPSAELIPALQMSFTVGEGSRTTLSTDNAVHFCPGDIISLFDYYQDNQLFATNIKSQSPTATFSGYAHENITKSFFVLYPYQEGASALYDTDEIYAQVPTLQTATAGSFDPKANLSVSKFLPEETKNFTLYNVCALAKFTLGDDVKDCKKVVLASNGKQQLAGDVYMDVYAIMNGDDSNASTGLTSSPLSSNSVTLQGNIESGTTYYIDVLPASCNSGITITCYNANGDIIASKSTGNTVTFKRAKVMNLGSIN